jgi:Domain of unknown function (DUF6457)
MPGMNREQWIAAFAAELGIAGPTGEEMEDLLKLASVAAHASERPAAPLACYLAGKSGRPATELIAIAERLA